MILLGPRLVCPFNRGNGEETSSVKIDLVFVDVWSVDFTPDKMYVDDVNFETILHLLLKEFVQRWPCAVDRSWKSNFQLQYFGDFFNI